MEIDSHAPCLCHLACPTGWDSATFQDKETEVPSLSWVKGTTGQVQNLATGRARTACQSPRRDAGRDKHYFSVKIRDGTQEGTGQLLLFSMISCFTTYFPVVESTFPVLEHLFLF